MQTPTFPFEELDRVFDLMHRKEEDMIKLLIRYEGGA
jgi:hypothetical protein